MIIVTNEAETVWVELVHAEDDNGEPVTSWRCRTCGTAGGPQRANRMQDALDGAEHHAGTCPATPGLATFEGVSDTGGVTDTIDQRIARERFVDGMAKLSDVSDTAINDAQSANTSWSDARAHLIKGLNEALAVLDPYDPADESPPRTPEDRAAANAHFVRLMYPKI